MSDKTLKEILEQLSVAVSSLKKISSSGFTTESIEAWRALDAIEQIKEKYKKGEA